MNQIRADQILSFRPRKKQRIVRQLHGVVAKTDGPHFGDRKAGSGALSPEPTL
jgi:hypothetical protein